VLGICKIARCGPQAAWIVVAAHPWADAAEVTCHRRGVSFSYPCSTPYALLVFAMSRGLGWMQHSSSILSTQGCYVFKQQGG
jgi:hypothetical protein